MDDSNANVKMLSFLLKKLGIKTTLASNGKEACEVVAADVNRFKLIFMDSLMPEMTGPEATKKLRFNMNYSNIIIGATGNVSNNDLDIFIQSGVDAVVPKPLSRNSVSKVIEYAMKQDFKSIGKSISIEGVTMSPR